MYIHTNSVILLHLFFDQSPVMTTVPLLVPLFVQSSIVAAARLWLQLHFCG